MTPLVFYTNIEQQEHRRLHAYGSYYIQEVDINMIPPFQRDVSKLVSDVVSMTLVNVTTEVETDVTTEMRDTGLQVLQQGATRDYNKLMYPSTVRLDIAEFDPGGYYLVLEDGVNPTLYSEVFVMAEHIHLTRNIRLEWCHGRDFEYSGGHLQYTINGFSNGYRNYMYLETVLVKPKYVYEREVLNKDGKEQPRKQIRKKVHRFEIIIPESIIDAISVVELHDQIKLTDTYGNEYDLDEFKMSQPNWFQNGALAAVTIEVVTETIAVAVVYGNGSAVDSCKVPAGICIPPTGSWYGVKSDLISGSMNWMLGQYVDENGLLETLNSGEYVTSGPQGSKLLYRYVSPNVYTAISLAGLYTKIYYVNNDEYWYDRGEGLNIRTSGIFGFNPNTTPPTYYGRMMDEALGELWLEDAGGARTFVQRVTNTDLDLGVQVEDTGFKYLVLVNTTVKCGEIMEFKKMIVPSLIVHSLDDDSDTYVLTLNDDDNTYAQSLEDLDAGPDL